MYKIEQEALDLCARLVALLEKDKEEKKYDYSNGGTVYVDGPYADAYIYELYSNE
jgi:hypothetical protein